jgi:DMSO/TMAO reductase YedYZ molybdopterin-dependent catalytic subunit
MAYGINEITLPPTEAFPSLLVAKDMYGHKWAKWIPSIEVTDKEVRGYWEPHRYSEKAIAGEFPFG